MASMFIKHRVGDFYTWKPAFDEHEPARTAVGVTSHSLHRDADDPNVLVIAFRVADIARAKEFVASDDLRTAMKHAGVVGPPEFWFAEDVEDRSY